MVVGLEKTKVEFMITVIVLNKQRLSNKSVKNTVENSK